MTIKHIKIIFGIIVVCGFIAFALNGYYIDKKAHATYVEEKFSGVIFEIKYIENRRGFPDIRINDRWIYLGIQGEKIQNYIKINDSIVKDSGTDTIKIYRKNNIGGWDEKVFE